MLSFIVLFHSAAAAMQLQATAERRGLAGRIIPVPRQLAAGCGMAWMAPAEAGEGILQALEEDGICYEKTAVMDYPARRTHEKRIGTGEGESLR